MALFKVHPNAVWVGRSSDWQRVTAGDVELLVGARVAVLPDSATVEEIANLSLRLAQGGSPSGAPPAGLSGAPAPQAGGMPPSGAPPTD